MRLSSLLLLFLSSSCSGGHLDAFSREVQATSGGAASGGTPSGGATSGGALQGGSSGNGNGSGGGVSGPLVLDDFEDGNAETLGGGGWWYTTADVETAQVNPSANAIDPSASNAHGGAHALRFYGGGCKSWCFLGVDLPGQPYLDARPYSKLSFWARLESTSAVRTLSVDVLDGTNVNAGSNAVHFRNDLELSTQWGNYTLNFSQLIPTEGNPATGVDRGRLDQIEFWIFTPDAFDISLDDVVFLP